MAAENLRTDGVAPDSIHVTGNTGIDAVFVCPAMGLAEGTTPGGVSGRSLDPSKEVDRWVTAPPAAKSFGESFEHICRALAELANRSDVQVVYPVHPNPNVQDPVQRLLAGHPNVHLIEPLSYVPFVDLMRRAVPC